MNSVPRVLLFFAAVFNTAIPAVASDDIATIDEFGQSINYALKKYYSPETIFVSLAVVLLLIFAVVFYETYREKKLRQALTSLAMAKFDLQAERSNLRLSSVALLKKIAQKSDLQDLSSIMRFSHVFENSLDKYYESEKIESLSNEMLEKISVLRKELGFLPLPRGTALASTRQLCSGDKCTIQIPENDPQALKETCLVLDCDERQWSISSSEGPVEAGTWVRVSITRQGDAEYTFRTQVLEASNEKLVLRHTNKLGRTQQRNWLRIDVSPPVNVTLMEEAHIGDIVSGKILDLSGGGLRMVLPTRLQNSSMVLLNFELPGHGQITDLLVTVVRVVSPPDGDPTKIVHSVAFANELTSAHEKIMKYVFEKQRENLSVMQT